MEPNTDHHDGLRKKIKEEGLSDIYVIVPVGAEDLGSKWVEEGEVDSIMTVCPLSLFEYSSTRRMPLNILFETLSPLSPSLGAGNRR